MGGHKTPHEAIIQALFSQPAHQFLQISGCHPPTPIFLAHNFQRTEVGK